VVKYPLKTTLKMPWLPSATLTNDSTVIFPSSRSTAFMRFVMSVSHVSVAAIAAR